MSQTSELARCVVCALESRNRCARCRTVYYCGKDHQRQDWARHKQTCTSRGSEHKPRAPATQQTSENIENAPKTKKQDSDSDTIKLSDKSVTSSVVHTNKDTTGAGAITYEGSSESEILSASTQQISSTENVSVGQTNVLKAVNRTVDNMPQMPSFSVEPAPKAAHNHKEYPEASLKGNTAPFSQNSNSFVMDNSDPYYDLCNRVIRDMSVYGVCVMDNFLGKERGMLVLNEVLQMYRSGIFQAGQLVSSPVTAETKTIRSDRITWIDGKEQQCFYIGNLIQQVDNIILHANKMPNNGRMGDFNIRGRTKTVNVGDDDLSRVYTIQRHRPERDGSVSFTVQKELKAMVACYPGSGTHYVKHVDNPNRDGRCITAIYYLNVDWDVARNGGLLRVFPEGQHQVADIAPIFDRMLFFWSDRRNPHEVQPSFNTRYAITLWYFDAQEREEATQRFHGNCVRAPSTSK